MSGAAHRLLAMAESGDPAARGRLRAVVEGATRGDRGAMALKAQIDAIASGRGVAGVIGASSPAMSPYAVTATPPGEIPFQRAFYDRVVHRDPLDRLYQAGQEIGLVRQAETGTPVPPTWRPLAGAQQNNRGHAVKVVGTSGTIQPIVVCETPKDCGEDAEVLLATLSWSFVDGDSANFDALEVQGTARIDFGTGGALQVVYIDYIPGTVIPLPASWARVTLIDAIVDAGCTVAFSASFAYGSAGARGYSSPARKTVDVADVIAPGATTALIPLPPFRSAMNLIAEPADALLRIGFARTSAGIDSSVDVNGFSSLANLSEQAIPIPNGARFFRVANLSVFQALNVEAIFNIAL